MPFMVWNDRLSVGVGALDDDHKKLVDMINELYDSILAGRGAEICSGMIDRLAVYTDDHFAREEALFAQAEYPDAEAHIAVHRRITAGLLESKRNIQAGTLAAPCLDLMVALKDELFDHVLGEDMKYQAYMRAKGIQ
ncbi:MAG: bacteriohemerythrin [Terracidiphilus sp.]|jgi:hemerythrin